MTSALPFLMFQGGVAREALDLYVSLFDDGAILESVEYGDDGPGPAGTIVRAKFRLAGQEFYASDSPVPHDFAFTPSLSIWIETDSQAQLEKLVDDLLVGGQALMPLGDYGFSTRFAWVNDRFGVSWQLNLT